MKPPLRCFFYSPLLLLLFSLLTPLVNAETDIESRIETMTDEELAAQMILVYYTNPVFVSQHAFGGVLIMQNMLKAPEQLRQELSLLQTTLNNKILVTIDQEGGKVNRIKYLKGWKNVPAASEFSQWENKKITAYSSRMAATLKAIGINMNLAPVLDPSHDYRQRKAFMGHERRAWGKDPDVIATKAKAFVAGFQSQGIASVAKHFPGYDVLTNSDHEIAISNAPEEALKQQVKPFAELSQQVDSVMMSSIHFTAINGKPAVLSPAMVSWARDIFPDALIMTDDLWGTALRSWMKDHGARSKNAQVVELTRLAIIAGNDVLMITYPEKALLMKAAITQWMREDSTFKERVTTAVRRILTVKSKMGLLPDKMPSR